MWTWERIDENRSGSSGDLAKLFRNEGVKQPGVLAAGAPPEDATLLAREAIQNSWDAATSLKSQLGLPRDADPPFELRFDYRDLTGDEKNELVERAGLRQLRDRIAEVTNSEGARTRLGLAQTDCLDTLSDPAIPLRILIIDERATTGMGGPWKGAASKLYLALVSVGFTVKDSGAGGSYGYGKAGLIRASHTRTVLAHTRFRERSDDPGVNSRLLGMTYWGLHDVGGSSFTGFARLGDPVDDDMVVPFENETADEWAATLGMPARQGSEPDQLGSTFLLIDPTVGPKDLCNAIERNWWPALEEKQFDVEIIDVDGTIHVPRPKRNDTLKPFLRGLELALTAQDNDVANEYRRSLGSYQPRASERMELGRLGLVADLEGWSYAQGPAATLDGELVDHESLVALVRGPMMVVEYLPVGRQQPYVRGTFVAHEDVDDLLRQTEPKAHDAWQRRVTEEGIDPNAPKVAEKVLKEIRGKVTDFKKKLSPPTPRERDIRLPLLDSLFRSLLDDKGTTNPPTPPPEPRAVSIHLTQHVEPAGDEIRLRATTRLALTDNIEVAEAECEVCIRYAWDEGGRRGTNHELQISAPIGFRSVEVDKTRGYVFRGLLSRHPCEFDLVSAPYPADWTGQLVVAAEPLVPPETPTAGDEEDSGEQ